MNSNTSPTNITGNALIQNAQGDVVAIVTDISPKNKADSSPNQSPQHLLSTNSNQIGSILPPLIPELNDEKNTESALKPNLSVNTEPNQQNDDNENTDNRDPAKMDNEANKSTSQSRWNKDNRMILKQLMGSLPPYDIGAALRVILDTFGVESSKLVRRGEYIELDLKEINDDYILDSLWNYCAQMQFNIMSTLQQQQLQQQQVHYPPVSMQNQEARHGQMGQMQQQSYQHNQCPQIQPPFADQQMYMQPMEQPNPHQFGQ